MKKLVKWPNITWYFVNSPCRTQVLSAASFPSLKMVLATLEHSE
jgi:hypothetical protein